MTALGSILKRDDLPHSKALKSPLGNRFCSHGATNLEHMDRHSDAQPIHANVHSPVSNFVFRHFLKECRQSLPHDVHSPRNTERFDSSYSVGGNVQPINALTNFIFDQQLAGAA